MSNQGTLSDKQSPSLCAVKKRHKILYLYTQYLLIICIIVYIIVGIASFLRILYKIQPTPPQRKED